MAKKIAPLVNQAAAIFSFGLPNNSPSRQSSIAAAAAAVKNSALNMAAVTRTKAEFTPSTS